MLGEVLADAFADDPVFAWLIPPDARGREGRLRTFFTSMSRTYLRQGKPCYLTAPAPAAPAPAAHAPAAHAPAAHAPAAHASAAALWAGPGRWSLPLVQMALESAPQGLAFRGNLLRALRVQIQIERLHARHTSAPHWYLGYLGARHDHQGQGLGSQLLREVLAGADADGIPAYLESSNERNLPLYERNGFRVVGELRALGRGPTIYRMWRE